MRAIRIGVNPDDVEIVEINNGLHGIEQIIGGDAKVWRNAELETMDIVGVEDERAILKGKPYNTNMHPFFVAGTMVLIAVDYYSEKGEHAEGLDDGQVFFAIEWLKRLKQ